MSDFELCLHYDKLSIKVYFILSFLPQRTKRTYIQEK